MSSAVFGGISRPGVSRPAIAAAAICIVLMGAGGLAAQDKPAAARPADKPKTVSNIFVDTDLREALQDIAAQLEVVIVPDNSVAGVVTCELKDATLDRALEIVLAGSGYIVKKMSGYYLVCSSDPTGPSFVLISQTRVIRLNYVDADKTRKLLSSSFLPYVQAGAKTNILCVTAPPALLDRITNDIALLDVPPRHVMLDARIVVLERSNLLNLGIQWGWPQIRAGTFSASDTHGGAAGAAWPWGIQIGYTPGREFTNSLLLTLNLIAQNEQATIIASPQLMAQDGKEAEIRVTTEEYFQITSEGIYTTSQLEKIETGTNLKIIPRISENGDITLELTVEVSGVIARGEDNLPVVSRRIAKSTVRLENGGTAAIAGLMDNRSQTRQNRVPGLSRLPLIGYLFQDKSDAESSRQVAVFVTAHVMPQKGEAPDEPPPDRPVIKPVGKKEFTSELSKVLQRLRTESQL